MIKFYFLLCLFGCGKTLISTNQIKKRERDYKDLKFILKGSYTTVNIVNSKSFFTNTSITVEQIDNIKIDSLNFNNYLNELIDDRLNRDKFLVYLILFDKVANNDTISIKDIQAICSYSSKGNYYDFKLYVNESNIFREYKKMSIKTQLVICDHGWKINDKLNKFPKNTILVLEKASKVNFYHATGIDKLQPVIENLNF